MTGGTGPEAARRAATARTAMRRAGLAGHDPYDALLSPLFRAPVLRRNRAVRFAAQQVVLRAPVNLRPVLRVPAQLNPVTVGLYLHGVADLAAAGEIEPAEAKAESERWVGRLADLVSPGCSGPAWGYPFPWEGRRHRLPAGTPTVVATSMVVNGLHRSWREFGIEPARGLVTGSARFVLEDLPRSAGDDQAFCWAYSPLDRQVVLNATLKGTRILAQALDAGLEDDRDRARTAAAASARFVTGHQRPDGAWPYAAGEDPRTWVDHHHTGYVLECLRAYATLTGDDQFEDAARRGWGHYRAKLFDSDLPRYYDDREGPLDATAAGQALITLSLYGEPGFAVRVARASDAALGRGDGTYAFQRRRGRLTRTHFIRWSTAWMFAGLAALAAAEGTT